MNPFENTTTEEDTWGDQAAPDYFDAGIASGIHDTYATSSRFEVRDENFTVGRSLECEERAWRRWRVHDAR